MGSKDLTLLHNFCGYFRCGALCTLCTGSWAIIGDVAKFHEQACLQNAANAINTAVQFMLSLERYC